MDTTHRKHEETDVLPVLARWFDIQEGEGEPPKVPILHHYTDAIGLHGIISSNSLWATAAQFSNDLSETQYAVSVAREVVTEVWPGKKNLTGWDQLLYEHVVQVFGDPPRDFSQSFLVSFCEDGDLLSQWRAYGRKAGFSIAFSSLMGGDKVLLRAGEGFRTLVRKVIYDPGFQRERLRLLLEKFVELVRGFQHPPNAAEGNTLHAELSLILIFELTDWACTVKHNAFSEEREWRLVTFPTFGESPDVLVRPTPDLLLPYIELRPQRGRKLPVVEIRCGPSRLQQESAHAAGILLRRHGHAATQVTRSDIPLRV